MPSYRVTWEVDVDADNAHDAARQAHEMVRRHDTSATVYKVVDSDGTATNVDLMEDSNAPDS